MKRLLLVIKKSPFSFVIMFFVSVGLFLIPYISAHYFIGPLDSELCLMTPPSLFSSYVLPLGLIFYTGSKYLALIIVIVMSSLLVSTFAHTGLILYLDSRSYKINPFSVFFFKGTKKYFRVFCVILLQSFVLLAIIFIPYMFFLMSVWYNVFYRWIVESIFSIFYLFFIFMVFEAVLTDVPVFSTIKTSFKKTANVFLSLFMCVIAYSGIRYYLQYSNISPYSSSSIHVIVVVLFLIFFIYPLFKHSTHQTYLNRFNLFNKRKKYPTKFVGSRNNIFHRVGCSHAKRIEPGTEVYFSTRKNAIESGFIECKDCKPKKELF